MRVTVVGCSGSFAGPTSAASCYLVQADDAAGRTWSVVLDLGSGSFGPLQRYVDPRHLDAVLLTHLHADHCADLTGMGVYIQYHPDGPGLHPPVYAPPGAAGVLAVQHTPEGKEGDTLPFDLLAWGDGEPVAIGPLLITPSLVEHPIPAYGLRIVGPREPMNRAGDEARSRVAVVSYSADSDECPGLDDLAQGSDLFLCEAAFVDGRDVTRGIHLTPTRAGLAAARARVERLVLTHLQPWNDAEASRTTAASHFPGPVDLAAPGLVYHL